MPLQKVGCGTETREIMISYSLSLAPQLLGRSRQTQVCIRPCCSQHPYVLPDTRHELGLRFLTA